MQARRAQTATIKIAAAVAALAFASAAAAQTFPAKPIRVVVPFAAGGITDILARALGQKLGEALGQPIVIDNRPGANSQVGAEIVARAAPDGYTLLVSADTTFVMNRHLYDKLSYDPLNDFVPVSGLGISPQALVVHPSVPARSIADLIALARKKPGELNYGTFGVGSSGHLNIELLQSLTGTKFTAVHYKGAAPALTDLIGGHTHMLFASISASLGYIRAGRLRALAVTTASRADELPELPTMREFVPGFEDSIWYGLGVTAGTPPEVIARLNREINAALADPAIAARLKALGTTVLPGTPADFARLIAEETAKWAEVVRRSGAKPD